MDAMPLPLRELYLEALELFTAEALAAADWIGLRSACSEWSIGDVVRHAIAIQRGNVIEPLAGAEPIGGGPELADVSAFAAIGVWEQVAVAAAAAVQDAPDDRLRLLIAPTTDLAMHAWDIRWGVARVGLAEQLELSASLLGFLERMRERARERGDDAMRAPGIFADEQRAAADASPTASVMAWAGRASLPSSLER